MTSNVRSTSHHKVKWTNEKVSFFWDYMSRKENSSYFAQEVGREVLSLTAKHIPLEGKILDYGTGNGFLIKYLLERNISVTVSACDFSSASVNHVNAECRHLKGFEECKHIVGLPTAFADAQFDVVFCLETIEHLIDDQFDLTIKEIYRLLKPGGYIVITTPNCENLSQQEVMCPDCGGVFHRVQHVNSYTGESLRQIIEPYGFSGVFSEGVNLYDFSKKGRLKRRVRNIASAVLNIKKSVPPNLVHIGKKNG